MILLTEKQVRAMARRAKRGSPERRVLDAVAELMRVKDAMVIAPREGARWEELVVRFPTNRQIN